MNLPEFGVKRPITNLMIFVGVIIISVYGLSKLGIDLMPEIEPPAISVISIYEGASPEDVETRVTEPLENQLGTTPGLDEITSRSLEGASVVTLEFNWGTNLDEASNDIRDRIDRTKRFLPDIPDEMDNPFIFKFNTAMLPVLYIGVTAEESYLELYDIIDERVADQLKQIPGVGTVQINGGLERQINIWIDHQKLEGHGFSISDIENVLRLENITLPAGHLKTGMTDYLVRIPGEFAAPEEIKTVILGEREGKVVYLKDVARIEDGFKEQTQIVRVNKNKGLLLFIQKQVGTNTVQVAEKVKNRIAELQKDLPEDIHFFTVMDTSDNILASLNTLRSTVFVGIILVLLVVWFFLRQFRPSIIIACAIPFSLLIAFIYLFVYDKTINVISLSGLVIAMGMVVDAAIVVTDNIYRHMEKGERPAEAAIFGGSEMFLAIAASVLTTVAVFAPLMFLKNSVIGIMFGELSAVVIITLLGSLFTATTFIPMLCSKWMRIRRNNSKGSGRKGGLKAKGRSFYAFSERIFQNIETFYSKLLSRCLNHRKLVIFGFLGMFIISFFLLRFVGTEFMPEQDSGDIRMDVSLPIGTRLEVTDETAGDIENIIEEFVPEQKFIFTRSGQTSGVGVAFGSTSGTHTISAGTKLVKKNKRKRSDDEVAGVLRDKIKKIPGILKTGITAGNPLGRIISGSGGKKIQIEIFGHSFEQTDKLAKEIKGIVEKTPGAVDVSITRELERPELQVKVDRVKASALGLNMNTITDAINSYIEGAVATRYREMGETYDVRVRLEEYDRRKIGDIENLVIVSPYTKKKIRLSNIAKIEETVGPVEIERKNRERFVKVEANTQGRSLGKIIEDIRGDVDKITIPEGISLNYGGEAEEQREAFADLFLLLLLGIALVYMVMAAQFESLLDPFIVMFAIPFTFTGVILAYILTNTPLSTIAFLGIVMLTGIVVNNAIVLISYINILRARGYKVIDAVTEGGRDRLRPVLMTTFTTLFAMIPMALSRGEGSEIWQPLGITMIGGLSVSTLITLLFVPTLYAVFESRIKKNGALK
jgi:HAE1 family hydrophobic/amphiphilic exporter-1